MSMIYDLRLQESSQVGYHQLAIRSPNQKSEIENHKSPARCAVWAFSFSRRLRASLRLGLDWLAVLARPKGGCWDKAAR